MSDASPGSRHGRGLNARADGPQDGVYIDGVHVFAVNVSAATVTPRGMFGTRTPPGASEGVNGVELLDFFAYVKSFHRTLDPQPQDGDAPTITVTFFDGPMPVTTYELENLNPALPPHTEGPTGDPTGMFLPSCPALGVPLMETDADGALLSRGRVDGFGLSISGGGDPITPEGGFNRDQIYCLVNGRRSTAAVVGDGTLLGAAAATPELRWVFTTDAVGTAASFARQQAGDSQTPDSFGGGAGTPTTLASPPVWDTANIPLVFGVGSGSEGDSPTAPTAEPVAPPSTTVAAAVQNSDADFNADAGTCACRAGDPSLPMSHTTADPATGAEHAYLDGNYRDIPVGVTLNGHYGSPLDDIGVFGYDLDDEGRNRSIGPSRENARRMAQDRKEWEQENARNALKAKCAAPANAPESNAEKDFNHYRTLVFVDLVAVGIGAITFKTGIGAVGFAAGLTALIAHAVLMVDAYARMGGGDLLGETGRQVLDVIGKIAGFVQLVAGASGLLKAIPGFVNAIKSFGQGAARLLEIAGGCGQKVAAGGATAAAALASAEQILLGAVNAAAGMAGVDVSTFFKNADTAASNGKVHSHHIATDKNEIAGEQWTKRFKEIFDNAGMKLSDKENVIKVAGHKGPHSNEYHRYVFRQLRDATKGKTGSEAAVALKAKLKEIAQKILTDPEWARKMGVIK